MARERVLHRLAALIEEHADELARYDALESGKPVTYVRAVDLELAIEPTATVGCSDSDAIVTDECSGPVVTVQPFDTEEELIDRVGTIRRGLTAGIWTRDLNRAHAVAAAMPAGTTWVNTYGDFSATAPWGGVNDSGLGRDCGPEGLEAFLQTRTTWVSLG